MRCTDPREMKRLGNQIKNYDDRKWSETRRDIVYTCVHQKFTTHSNARECLLNTEEKSIGEATRSRVWGVGLHISDPRVLDHSQWCGYNIMGEILMVVRRELRGGDMEVASEATESSPAKADESSPAKVDQSSPAKADESSPAKADESTSMVIDSPSAEPGARNKSKRPFVVCIGDSNMRGLNVTTHIPVDVVTAAAGGTRIEDVEERISEIQLPPSEVKVVALHVGTCSWKSFEEPVRQADVVYREYIEALTAVSTRFPHSEIVISSIPARLIMNSDPNRAKINTDINTQTDLLNKKLCQLCQTESNLSFIDNDVGLKVDAHPCADLYSRTDITGVHLGSKGRCILEDNLRDKVQEAFFKSRLQQEWDIVATPKK